MMVDEASLAYTAGVIDSDGSIGVMRRKRKCGEYGYCVRMDVAMTSELVPTWLHSRFGGCLFKYQPTKGRRKPMWKWGIYSRHATELMSRLMPYLIEKSNRAKLAIELQSHMYYRQGRRMPPVEELRLRDSIFEAIRQENLTRGRCGVNQHSVKKGVS